MLPPPDVLDETCDVVVLGTGLAALCLTRLLHLEHPSLRVVTVDKAAGPSRKVGESTVEIAAHFLHTRLGLANVLCRTQLPKNGLRFWFDDAHRSLPLTEASEDGPITFPYWQSYQLDRELFEQTLLDLNRTAGAVHLFGATAVGVGERDADGRHVVSFTHDGRPRRVAGRWLVDATGFHARWGRSIGLLQEEPRISHSACWARFRNFRSPDDLLAERHDRRPIVGRRVLSTNHLMHEGYWIWWIPLAGGLMSVGLVWDQNVLRKGPRNVDEFVSFLRAHRMCAELMAAAEPIDFGRLQNYSSRPVRYFAEDRTGAIGMAGGFVDPLYSGGSDLIALACEYLSQLIGDDLLGDGLSPAKVDVYNRALRAYYEQTVLFVHDVYKTFASYELNVVRYRRDLHVYWSLFVWPYFSRELRQAAFLERWLPLAAKARERGEAWNRLLRGAYDELTRRGELRRRNRGEYAFNQLGYGLVPFIRFERQMGNPMDLGLAERLLDEIDAASILGLADVLHDGRASPRRALLHAAARESLDELLLLERELGPGPEFWRAALPRIGAAAAARLRARGIVLGAFELGPEQWAAAGEVLAAAATDPDQRRMVQSEFAASPELEDVPLPHARDRVQPPSSWSLEHTPWELRPLDVSTVYDMMARRPDSIVTRLWR